MQTRLATLSANSSRHTQLLRAVALIATAAAASSTSLPHDSVDGKEIVPPSWHVTVEDKCNSDASARVVNHITGRMFNRPFSGSKFEGGLGHPTSVPPSAGRGASGYAVAGVAAYIRDTLGRPADAAKLLELIDDGKLAYLIWTPGGVALPAADRLARMSSHSERQAVSDYNTLVLAYSEDQFAGITAVLVLHELEHVCNAHTACTASDPLMTVLAVDPMLPFDPATNTAIGSDPATAFERHACRFVQDLLLMAQGDIASPPVGDRFKGQVRAAMKSTVARLRAGLAAQQKSLDPTLDDAQAAVAADLFIKEKFEALRANAVPPVPSGALPPSLQGADLSPHQELIECIFGVM